MFWISVVDKRIYDHSEKRRSDGIFYLHSFMSFHGSTSVFSPQKACNDTLYYLR
jgi:hypothetical protein